MILGSFGFYLGSVAVLVWACGDAQRPMRSATVRFATDQRRYALALGLYAGTFFAAYVFAVLGARGVADALGAALSDSTLCLAVALGIVALLPRLPGQARVLKPFRRIAMGIAGFPDDLERLVATMQRPRLLPAGIAQLDAALEIYGANAAALRSWMAEESFASLAEAARLRGIIETERGGDDPRAPLPSSARRFFRSREARTDELNTAWRKLVRRCAMSVDLVADAHMPAEVAAPISEFLAEEAEEVVRSAQRILAEYALSQKPAPEARVAFFDGLGYSVPTFVAPPVAPLLVVVAVELLLFGLAFLGPLLFGRGGAMGGNPLLMVLHMTGMVLAVGFSIYPKFFLNAARPSLRTMPWKSNLASAGAAYVAGVLVSLAAQALRPGDAPMSPAAFVFGGSFFFAAVTLGLCIAVDLRLRDNVQPTTALALRDAVLLGGLLVGVDLLLRLFVGLVLGGDMPPVALTVLVLAGLGALTGWFIPAMVMEYLDVGLAPTAHGDAAAQPRRAADQRTAASLLLEERGDVH
jgi:hypothetical protein